METCSWMLPRCSCAGVLLGNFLLFEQSKLKSCLFCCMHEGFLSTEGCAQCCEMASGPSTRLRVSQLCPPSLSGDRMAVLQRAQSHFRNSLGQRSQWMYIQQGTEAQISGPSIYTTA